MVNENQTWAVRILPVRRIAVRPDIEMTARILGSRKKEETDPRFRAFYASHEKELLRFIKPMAVAAWGEGQLALVMTLGKVFDRYLAGPEHTDDLYAQAVLGAMGDSCLFSLEEEAKPHLRRLLREAKMGLACRLAESPDSVRRACAAVHAQRTMGIVLTPDGSMQPAKSMAITFLTTDDESKFAYEHDCAACTSHNCPMRSTECERGDEKQTSVSHETFSDMKVICPPGANILTHFQQQGIPIAAPCGGRGMCGKCRVRVISGSLPIQPEDRRLLSPEDLENGIRLACCAVPDKEVTVAPVSLEQEMEAAGLAEITGAKSSGDENIRQNSTASKGDSQEVSTGNVNGHTLGIGIDLGTTTIAGALVDLTTGEVLSQSSTINHQRTYGADVVSRMMASMDGKREALSGIAHRDIGQLCQSLTKDQVEKVVIAGNTAMEHMYAGDPCDGLASFPFHPVSLDRREAGRATLLPGISAYVGADILAGLYALSQTEEGKPFLPRREGGEERTCLFLDLGTNGEMAISKGSTIYVASTAAGPALEGGNISCGTGSIPGAISRVRLGSVDHSGSHDTEGQDMEGTIMQPWRVHQGEDYTSRVRTIGDASPTGICGTGIIEALAEFLRIGIMDTTGLLQGKHFREGVTLAPGITICQEDIRQVQMAKGAICAGLKILMERAEVDAYDIDALYLAGGFGLKLDPVRAGAIGLIPQDLVSKTRAVGNTSLMGAVHSLTDPAAERVMEEIRSRCREIILGNEPGFEVRYIEEMDFPSAL
ncbi:MAG: ASKHA domain-containing protein [Lachnospiraceae bacterium]|nr:ASKHA domain-containing protein [Lachnospiraceae bacterium]